MRLSISNIGWAAENDIDVYHLMRKYGYSGLEIAPTRIFLETPYDKNEEAREWSKRINKDFEFQISSMQSIWYGRKEKLFGSEEERKRLVDYTKKAIDFAAMIGCNNLVFGCPQNRNLPAGVNPDIAVVFFKELGDYSAVKGTTIGMEANPVIYNTNYINDTVSALELIQRVNSQGFKLNLDIGTMIHNEENVSELQNKVKYINHVHISEPGLKPIEKRKLHSELLQILVEENYQGYISIEMGRINDLAVIEEKMEYVRRIFA